ncbi:MAG: FAD-dependent monooxygenase [Pseudomonadota bacterium]
MTERAILIVGAGPSGLTAALELARRGFRPRIVDCAEAPPEESRALAINPRSLAILKPLGLSDRLIEAGTPIRKAYLRGPERLLLQIDLSALPKPYDFMLMLPQSETERLMAEHLAELGIEVERSTTLLAMTQDAEGNTAELRGPDGALETCRPDMVIGADGAHSVTRQAIGQDFVGSAYEHQWGLADATIETDLPLDGINFFDRAPNLAAIFPIKGRRVRLLSDREAVLDSLPPEVRVAEVHWTSTFRISHRLVERYRSGNVFLVGDAAHIHSPFGGRGMNLGIEDAAWLAWLIDEGDTAGYTVARRPVAKEVIETVDPATRFMASDGALQKFVRRRIVPLLGALGLVQRRMLPIVSAQNTPFPPWLRR